MRERLKRCFPLWKHILALSVLVMFAALILWNQRHQTGYFPEWLSRRKSSYIWAGIIAILLTYWGKWAVASGLTLGWVLGVPIAQIIGDSLYAHHRTIYTAEQMIYVGHKHAYIWWLSIAVGVLLGLIVQIVVWLCRKGRKRLPPVDSRDFTQYRAT